MTEFSWEIGSEAERRLRDVVLEQVETCVRILFAPADDEQGFESGIATDVNLDQRGAIEIELHPFNDPSLVQWRSTRDFETMIRYACVHDAHRIPRLAAELRAIADQLEAVPPDEDSDAAAHQDQDRTGRACWPAEPRAPAAAPPDDVGGADLYWHKLPRDQRVNLSTDKVAEMVRLVAAIDVTGAKDREAIAGYLRALGAHRDAALRALAAIGVATDADSSGAAAAALAALADLGVPAAEASRIAADNPAKEPTR